MFKYFLLVISFALALGAVALRNQTRHQPGIVLSFDDRASIESWGEARLFLKKHGIKATFFVDKFDALTDRQLNVLRRLAADGHEIGSHGFRHLNARESLTQGLSLEAYLAEEIEPSIKHMTQLGFPPRSFAYPHGTSTMETDTVLRDRFAMIRKVDASTAYYLTEHGSFIGAIYIDHGSSAIGILPDLLDGTIKRQAVISLSAHKIGPLGGTYWCTFDVLETLAIEAHKRGLPFLTMSELADRAKN